MLKNNKLNKLVSVTLAIIMALNVCSILSFSVFAYSEMNYEEAGYSFLIAQYDLRNIEYDFLIKEEAIDLYDKDNNVVAKMMIVNRDGKIDYVVLDFMIDRVDEFGFDQEEFVNKFKNKEKIYYAGTLNYAYYDGENLKNIDGNQIDETSYFELMEAFITYSKLFPKQVDDVSDGFANWQDIDDDTANLPNSTGYGGSVTNSFWSYIPGITVDGVSPNLNFQDQDVLNANYNNTFKKNITGTCALVAITNMFIYYEYIGFDNALLYDSVEYTFDRALTEINWLEWSDSNWWRNTVSGLKSMASKAGYDYKINQYNNLKWNDVTSSIDSDMPIFTYIYAEQTDGYEFAHAVVTVGYEEFIHKYTTTEQYWLFGWKEKTVEHEDMYRYLRVVDGWSSSNDSRYIDFNGFFTTVKGIAFMLEE